MRAWSEQEVARLTSAQELRITTYRSDGTRRKAVPIWVVVVDGQAFVRTWHPRTNGWYGHAVASRAASISVPGLEVDVDIELVGAGGTDLQAAIDDAYRAKYGTGGGMVTEDSVASTLRLDPGTQATPGSPS